MGGGAKEAAVWGAVGGLRASADGLEAGRTTVNVAASKFAEGCKKAYSRGASRAFNRAIKQEKRCVAGADSSDMHTCTGYTST